MKIATTCKSINLTTDPMDDDSSPIPTRIHRQSLQSIMYYSTVDIGCINAKKKVGLLGVVAVSQQQSSRAFLF